MKRASASPQSQSRDLGELGEIIAGKPGGESGAGGCLPEELLVFLLVVSERVAELEVARRVGRASTRVGHHY